MLKKKKKTLTTIPYENILSFIQRKIQPTNEKFLKVTVR